MHHQAVLVSPGTYRLNFFQRINSAATSIVRVLQRYQARANQVIVRWANLILQLAHVEYAMVSFDRSASYAAQDRRAARLKVVDMAQSLAEHFVARHCMRLDADLVRHRPRRDEECRFLA